MFEVIREGATTTYRHRFSVDGSPIGELETTSYDLELAPTVT